MNRTIPIRGVIGADVTAENFSPLLEGITADDAITFDISSPGGSVLVGFEIFNEIKNLPTKDITFEINGIAASIASVIVMAGAKIHASEFSLFMIHKASTGAEGNSIELQQQIEILNKIDELLVDTYHGRNKKNGKTKLTRDQIVAMMEKETWLTPAEGVEYGFIDKIINKTADVNKLAAKISTMEYLQKLKRLMAQGGKLTVTPEDVKAAMVQALAGKKYSNLSDEELNTFLTTVKGLIEEKLGGTLGEEEMAAVNAALNEAVMALQTQEEEESTDGQIAALTKVVASLKETIDTISKSVVETGQGIENLSFEITALKKDTRTFGRKPFVNEAGRLDVGAAYQAPHKKFNDHIANLQKGLKK